MTPKKWTAVPLTITKVRLPARIVQETVQALRRGSDGVREWVVLWQGKIVDDTTAEVTKVHIPRQDTGPLHFNISLQERLRLVEDVSANGEFILVQLHTHPHEAFHSDADDRLAIPKHTGAISIVIADFAIHWTGDLLNTCVFRHLGAGRWRQLAPHDVTALLEVLN